ncbi:MAG: hypothetical protein HGB17_12055, partial [Syntrophobacteraceae bacterium]|nr:hypothetical protein [Syntrophobacteraceae bacterium]
PPFRAHPHRPYPQPGDLVARALIAPLVLTVFWAGAALAQPVADSTRPPSRVEAGSGPAGTAQTPVSPLQSVILRPGAKPRALLSGEWIELGKEYNGARLIKVTETSVTLKGPSGDEANSELAHMDDELAQVDTAIPTDKSNPPMPRKK